LSGVH